MALGNVFIKDSDNNIGKRSKIDTDKVCGLLFDISAQKEIFTSGTGTALREALENTVVEINSIEEAVKLGIKPHEGEDFTASAFAEDFLSGIAYYHIDQFFKKIGGSGKLFVAFADCSKDWNAIINMQKAANGRISQLGVWTEQHLWEDKGDGSPAYTLELVGTLNAVGVRLANEYFAPLSIVLSANTSKVKTTESESTEIAFDHIPSCITNARYVSVLISQAPDDTVRAMQASLKTTTPVGIVGLTLGALAEVPVGTCVGFVGGALGHSYSGNLEDLVSGIEMGFGNSVVSGNAIKNSTSYEALDSAQLDELDDKGYMFMRRFAAYNGIYFNYDSTCSDGDYCTIALNKVINKSRRLVREALLPYVNFPVKVDPANGRMPAAQIAEFYNIVSNVLLGMEKAGEISAVGKIEIPADHNVLKERYIPITYTLILLGCSKEIRVTSGFAVSR